jgi:hypothetical protein
VREKGDPWAALLIAHVVPRYVDHVARYIDTRLRMLPSLSLNHALFEPP